MASRVYAAVKPELLVWAREDAGYSLDKAAEKLRMKPSRLASWESGEASLTIPQLRKLSRLYKRPIAVFYLSKPPKKFQAMRDFRRLPGVIAGRESPDLRFEIRRVRRWRELAIELYERLEIEPPTFDQVASLSDDPEEIAENVRLLLRISTQHQASWTGKYEALNAWRTALEVAGVLVFQIQNVDVDEARAFSLSEIPLPSIAINIKDAVRGRIFSMLHELVHLMLRDGGLCDLHEYEFRSLEEERIEVFCNHVAGAILLPQKELLANNTVYSHGSSARWDDSELNALSRDFWVSREAVLRRLLVLGRTTESYYQDKRKEFLREYAERRQQEGFAPPYIVAVSAAGHLFVNLVLESFYREKITSSDVSDYLDVRLKHLPRIEAAARRFSKIKATI